MPNSLYFFFHNYSMLSQDRKVNLSSPYFIASFILISALLPLYIQVTKTIIIWLSTPTVIICHLALTYCFICIVWLFYCLFSSKYRRSIIGKFTSNRLYIFKSMFYGIFSVGIPVIIANYSMNYIPSYIISLFSPLVIFFSFLLNILNRRTNSNFKINLLTKLIFWFGYIISLFSTDFLRILLSSFEMYHYLYLIFLYLFISFGMDMISKLPENNDIFLSSVIQLMGPLVTAVFYFFISNEITFERFVSELIRIPSDVSIILFCIGPLIIIIIQICFNNLIRTFPSYFVSYISFAHCAFSLFYNIFTNFNDISKFVDFSFFTALALMLNFISLITNFDDSNNFPQKNFL